MRNQRSEHECGDNDHRAGFTLLELVLVVGIFGMVMSMAYQILSTTLEADRRVNRNTRTGKIGEGILTQMRRDVLGTVWRSLGPEVFRGIDGGSGDGAEDELHFLTTSTVPDSPDQFDNWSGAVASVGYVLKPTGDGNYTLFRRVKWEIQDSPLDDGQYYEVYNRVRSLEINYLGREEEWLDEWDKSSELEALENQNWDTFIPYRDDLTALEEQDALDAAEGGDLIEPGSDDPALEEEEPEIPLPVPRAVEIILTIAVGDERGEFLDHEGEILLERVSTIVPIICSEVLRVEDPAAVLDDEGL
jgi:type II secretion system protein J